MITVEEADKLIQENIRQFPIIEVPIEEACGAVLREDIKADRDLPPFNKALMDGVAVKYSALKAGQRTFKIKGTQAAGVDALSVKKAEECIEIMTGAVVSKGTDCIIPVETIKIEEDFATIDNGFKPKRNLNIRPKGADHKRGDLLIKQGSVLKPQHIATAAAVGKATIKVSYKPKVAIISTGDELVDVSEDVKPYQIRKSNSYFMQSALDGTHLFETAIFHFKDNKKTLLRQIGAILEKYDVLVLTGGISMGKFDFIPEVMKELNVDVVFQKVKQKPGKPFWYGRTKRNQPVFALPGNPVSTQVGITRYVVLHLKKALGVLQEEKIFAELKENFTLDTSFTYFLPVVIECTKEGKLLAIPIDTGGSGDFAATVKADGVLELPANTKEIKKGFCSRFYPF